MKISANLDAAKTHSHSGQYVEMNRLVQFADVPAQLWKNKGGTTQPIAEGQGWRVSLAQVTRDGPFSVYPNTHRHSVVIGGDALLLRAGYEHVVLEPNVVSSYVGDFGWNCELQGTSATVLNVICATGVTADIVIGRQMCLRPRAGGAIIAVPIRCSMAHVTGSRRGIAPYGTAIMSDCDESFECHIAGKSTNADGYIVAIRLRT